MSIHDLLTPEELDALLNEVDEGRLVGDESQSEAQGDVVAYDFSAQEHIVRSSMPTLEMIYEKFSRRAYTTLSGLLRRGVAIELVGIESLRYADWFAQLPPHCGMHLVKARPLHGTALFVLHAPLVYMLVDAYFGGRADEDCIEERIAQRKEITQAELRITRIMIERMARDLEAAWAPVYKIAIDHAGIETNPLFASIASPPERVIAARFGVRLGSMQSQLTFVIPYAMVEPIKALLDNGLLSEHSDIDRRWRESLIESLQNVPLELRGTLVETVIPIRAILTMRPGDVIPIDIPKQLAVDLEGAPAFRGALGFAKGKKAVKITQTLAKDGEPRQPDDGNGSGSAPRGETAKAAAHAAEPTQRAQVAACA